MSPKPLPSFEGREDYYRENYFQDLQREIAGTARDCKEYQELCAGVEFDFDMTLTEDNLESVPYIPSKFYKNSLNRYLGYLRVPQERLDLWHISSSTSQDPSVVGRTAADIEQLCENWLMAWLKFAFMDKYKYVANFAPGHLAMKFVARRSGADVKNGRLYVDFINGIMDPYANVEYTIKMRFLKSIGQLLRGRVKAVAEIDKNVVLKFIKKAGGTEGVCFGGNPLLMNRLVTTEFKGEEHPLGDNGYVVTGGGGWDGVKAQLKMGPLPKTEFIEAIEKVFHIPRSHFADNYTFTETPSSFLAHWSDKHENFVMHVMPTTRIVVRDVESLEPLKPGDEGLLQVITPYGVEGSANLSVLVDDVVLFLGDNTSKCPECGHEGATFIIQGRLKDAPGRSCSSILSWMDGKPE
jgi:hypothetical protein